MAKTIFFKKLKINCYLGLVINNYNHGGSEHYRFKFNFIISIH